MSNEAVDLVRSCFEAYLRGDAEAALAAFDPQVEFDMTIRPDGRVFHGLAGVAEAMHLWTEVFDELQLEAEGFMEAGDQVLIIGKQKGHARGSGLDVRQPFFHVATVRDGRIVHWKAFADRTEALRAAGLTE